MASAGRAVPFSLSLGRYMISTTPLALPHSCRSSSPTGLRRRQRPRIGVAVALGAMPALAFRRGHGHAVDRFSAHQRGCGGGGGVSKGGQLQGGVMFDLGSARSPVAVPTGRPVGLRRALFNGFSNENGSVTPAAFPFPSGLVLVLCAGAKKNDPEAEQAGAEGAPG